MGRIRRRSWSAILIPAVVVATVAQLAVASQASVAPKAPHSGFYVQPRKVNEIDCNGWSSAYRPLKPSMRSLCTDPVALRNGQGARFLDNGWYVGHDEPSVKFISSKPGSGNDMTYMMKLPSDPKAAPTASGSVTKYGELSIAPWFGLPMCDPQSYTQKPCKPDSDANKGGFKNKDDAGDAFLELQLYPPGFGPFTDAFSCSQSYWCAAITIDSDECQFGNVNCNTKCEEPVNAAFLQTNGVPTGPPSPQLADVDTNIPNSHTLKMYGGDVLVVSMYDTKQGYTTSITDLTRHETGYMVASAANGFMDTSYKTCAGQPFAFHAEYSTAKQQNQVPWAALEGGVLMEQEIGHFEACNSVSSKEGFSVTDPNGQSYTDADVAQVCDGGPEGATAKGEGPCSATTGICKNSTTQGMTGPVACPTKQAGSGQLCEFSDGFCFPKGPRPVSINGVSSTISDAVAACEADQFQNGDLDFDGIPYQPATWPNGTKNTPTQALYAGPFLANGQLYPTVQFETDVGGSSHLCDVSTGAGCDVKPLGSNFYPFWSLNKVNGFQPVSSSPGMCLWSLGNTVPNVTVNTFGKDAQYGTPDTARFAGTIISKPMANPEFAGSCA